MERAATDDGHDAETLPEDGPEHWRLMEEIRRCVREALDQLSERDSALIRRIIMNGQTYREVAEIMKMTINAVGVALFRAKERLIAVMKEICPDLM